MAARQASSGSHMTIEHWIFLLEKNVSFEIWMSQWSLAKNPNLSTDQDDEEKPKLPYLSSTQCKILC